MKRTKTKAFLLFFAIFNVIIICWNYDQLISKWFLTAVTVGLVWGNTLSDWWTK